MDPLRKSFNPNKQLKEEFVSNLTGTSMLEIAALSTIVPALILLRHSISFNCLKTVLKKKDGETVVFRDWRIYMAMLALDFLFIILPILLFFTVLAEWANMCAVLLLIFLLLCIVMKRFGSYSPYSKGRSQSVYSIRTNISSYRVSMMIVTCLCILAVDFQIFPRRYAKAETYGTGLMDLGVGSFVLANSLVSRQARNALSVKWKTALKSTSPLLLLGVGRLIFTTGVDYQVHVGEYGVHWNFFFTLAAVSILTFIINIHPQYCGILGSLILIGYQICLMSGLNEYVISNERAMNIISQNKEGIFSIFGYWGLYLLGVQLGNYLFFGNDFTGKMRNSQWTRTRIWILSVIFWLSTIILDKHIERVSRRMCNLAYVTFVLAQNFQVLAILMLSDFIPGEHTSILEEAYNRNLLGTFLLANVLTGLINLYVDTISESTFAAFSILVGYSIVLSALIGIADFSGIKLKFW
ncbi:PREDICTED: uncharacterized protein At4g17910 isoform X2 [Nelumbo nucifera]|uniref:Uncharacterized protein At4g17910 isoform X2 n=1 Tax=Nelumbo nucifera TaxID=4432 RepID=A0A1U7YT72_NELNU|nr:PREDICTED: uncharacterized protein At4g17910 isoform X2 [Nelumbo nucifera]